MPILTKDTESSSVAVSGASSPSCEGCPRISTAESGSVSKSNPSDFTTYNLLRQTLLDTEELRKEIEAIKTEQQKSKNFYTSLTKLGNVARFAVIMLMITPFLQLLACIVIVHYLGIQDQLPGLLYWVLSGVSILSVFEVGVLVFKFNSIENRIDQIEKNID